MLSPIISVWISITKRAVNLRLKGIHVLIKNLKTARLAQIMFLNQKETFTYARVA